MRSITDNFHRLIRKAARDTRLGVVAVAVGDKPASGGVMGLYSAADISPEQLDFAAQTLLDLVIQQGGDPACPCCADRLERAQAALEALRAKPAEPVTSLH